MKKKSQSIKASVTSPVAGAASRQFRERITRVGIVTKPIKGKDTNAKHWNRWTP